MGALTADRQIPYQFANYIFQVLFQGLKASAAQIITIVMAFLVICFGITILQMSKVDPTKLGKLDRRSTLLLQAARAHNDIVDEKDALQFEDPGMDTLRGSFGTVGSIIRARTVRRMSQSSQLGNSNLRMRPPGAAAPHVGTPSWMSQEGFTGMKRHQLYDAPVPRADDVSSIHAPSVSSPLVGKRPTIKFDDQDLIHQYNRPGEGPNSATHEHRQAVGSMIGHDGYPPLPPLPSTGNLLGIESPDLSRNSDVPSVTGKPNSTSPDQILDLPALLGKEHAVHSAPPTIYARFARPPGPASPTRKDSRELFDNTKNSPSTARATLLSFPSVTDSAPSEWGDEEFERSRRTILDDKARSRESLHAPSKKEKEKERSRERPKTPKKYPKVIGSEDQEETEALWRRKTSTDEDEGPPPTDGGSIRLVQPGPKF